MILFIDMLQDYFDDSCRWKKQFPSILLCFLKFTSAERMRFSPRQVFFTAFYKLLSQAASYIFYVLGRSRKHISADKKALNEVCCRNLFSDVSPWGGLFVWFLSSPPSAKSLYLSFYQSSSLLKSFSNAWTLKIPTHKYTWERRRWNYDIIQ